MGAERRSSPMYVTGGNRYDENGVDHVKSLRPPYDIEWVKARLTQCGVLCPEGFEESAL